MIMPSWKDEKRVSSNPQHGITDASQYESTAMKLMETLSHTSLTKRLHAVLTGDRYTSTLYRKRHRVWGKWDRSGPITVIQNHIIEWSV